MKRRATDQQRRGIAAVECAVLLPFLLFLMVMSVDFARVFYFSQVIENCATNGAAYLSDPSSPTHNLYTSLQQAAVADAGNLSPQPTITSSTGTDASGNAFVSVTASWQFRTFTSFPGVPNVTLTRTVRMRSAP